MPYCLPLRRVSKQGIIGVVLIVSLFVFSLTREDFVLAQEPESGSVAVKDKEYVIAPNDVIGINVYDEKELSVTVRVASNGYISYPLLGMVKAAGLDVSQLEKVLADLLGEDYLVHPQVSVFVKEYSKISVIGQVMKPGLYEIKARMTVMQAIALAGGFTDGADTSVVKIYSGGSEKASQELDLEKIRNKEQQDVELKAGDTIMVEEAGRISIMGQISRPGVYSFKKGVKVVEAIARAGGFTATAAQDGTRIIRVVDGQKQAIKVPVGMILKGGDESLDVELEPNDTIVVPESFF